MIAPTESSYRKASDLTEFFEPRLFDQQPGTSGSGSITMKSVLKSGQTSEVPQLKKKKYRKWAKASLQMSPLEEPAPKCLKLNFGASSGLLPLIILLQKALQKVKNLCTNKTFLCTLVGIFLLLVSWKCTPLTSNVSRSQFFFNLTKTPPINCCYLLHSFAKPFEYFYAHNRTVLLILPYHFSTVWSSFNSLGYGINRVCNQVHQTTKNPVLCFDVLG